MESAGERREDKQGFGKEKATHTEREGHSGVDLKTNLRENGAETAMGSIQNGVTSSNGTDQEHTPKNEVHSLGFVLVTREERGT